MTIASTEVAPQSADEVAPIITHEKVAGDLPCVQVGPVVGSVSSRSAKILLECDVVADVSCLLMDRITGESVTSVQRTKRCFPVVFHICGLSPGRVYDVSFRGLADVCTAILQTPYEDPVPSWTLAVMSDDKFLDGSVQYGAMLRSDEMTGGASSFLGDIASHLLPATGGMFADATLHLGISVCLAHDLSSAFNLCAHDWNDEDGRVRPHSLARFEALARQCVRRHWSLPECKELFSRGAHVFSSVGIMRSLLANNERGDGVGIPVEFLVRVRNVLQEYEAAGRGMVVPSELPERFLRRLSSGVMLLSLDTLENVLDSASTTQFVQSQATLLSASQWEVIETLLLPTNEHSDRRSAPQCDDPVKLLVVLCDVPLVWHDATQDIRHLWYTKSNGTSTRSPVVYANAWSLYPAELDRLLQLIFRKKQRVRRPACLVVVVRECLSLLLLSAPTSEQPKLTVLLRRPRSSRTLLSTPRSSAAVRTRVARLSETRRRTSRWSRSSSDQSQQPQQRSSRALLNLDPQQHHDRMILFLLERAN